MKNYNQLFSLFVLLASIFFTSCSGGSSGEPNNSIDLANDIVLSEPFEISIDPKGDVDWFKVEISEQGYLNVQASNVPEGINVQAKFALFQEWEGKKEKELKAWTSLPAVLHVAEAGTYYFVIHDDWDDASSVEPITIKVDFTKEFDGFEFNNNAKTAKEAKFGEVEKIFIYPTGDQDWFKVNVDKQGYIKAMVREKHEGVNPQVKFVMVDEWSDEKVKELTGWIGFPGAVSVPDSAQIYIIVHDDWDDGSSLEGYDLKLDYIEQMDDAEPNNDYNLAANIKRGDTLTMAIFPTGDNDFYKLTVEEGDKIKISGKDWDPVIVPQVKIYTLDEMANKLVEYRGWKNIPYEFEVEAGEVYYIQIHDDWDDASSEKPFMILIE